MNKFIKLFYIAGTALGLASVDNFVKEKIEDGSINNGVINHTNGFTEIEKHHNKGLPLNKLDSHTKEITAVSTAVLAVQAVNTIRQGTTEDNTALDVANTFILAGALSNTYDRIKRGYVVDYLKVHKKRAIYNISDFMIIFGVFLTVINAVKDCFKTD